MVLPYSPGPTDDEEDVVTQAALGSIQAQYTPPPPPPPPPPPAPSGHEGSFEPAPPPVEAPPPAAPTPDYGFGDQPAASLVDTYQPQPEVLPTIYDPVQPVFQPSGPTLYAPTPVAPPVYQPPDITKYVDTGAFQYAGGNLLDSGWFGTPQEQEQQVSNWNADYTRAVQNGDTATQQALLNELNAAQTAWRAYGGWTEPGGMDYHTGVVDYLNALTQAGNTFNQQASQYNALTSPSGEGFGRRVSGPTPQAAFDQFGNITQLRSDVARQQQNIAQYQQDHPQYITDEGKYDLLMESHPVRTMLDALDEWRNTDRAYAQQQIEEAQRYQNDPEAQAYFATAGPQAYGPGGSLIGSVVGAIAAATGQGVGYATGLTTEKAQAIKAFLEGNPLEGAYATSQRNQITGQQPQHYRSQGGLPLASTMIDDTLRAAGAGTVGYAQTVLTQAMPEVIKRALQLAAVPGQTLTQSTLRGYAQAYLAVQGVHNPQDAVKAILPIFNSITNPIGTSMSQDIAAKLGKPKSQEAIQAAAMVDRFQVEHPWLYLAASLPLDPLNYIGAGEVGDVIRVGKQAVVTEIAARNAFTAEEAAVIFSVNPSWRTMYKWREGANWLAQNTVLRDIGNTKVRDALALRMSIRSQIAEAVGGDGTLIWDKELESLPALVKRMGGTDADVQKARQVIQANKQGFRSVDIALTQFGQRWRAAEGMTPSGMPYRPGGAIDMTGLPAGTNAVSVRFYNGPFSRIVTPRVASEVVEANSADVAAALSLAKPSVQPRNYGAYRFVNLQGDAGAATKAAEETAVALGLPGMEGTPIGSLPVIERPRISGIEPRQPAPPGTTLNYDRAAIMGVQPRGDYDSQRRALDGVLDNARMNKRLTNAQRNRMKDWTNPQISKYIEEHNLWPKKQPGMVPLDPNDPFSPYVDPAAYAQKGYNVNITDTGTVEDVAAAANDDVIRQAAAESWKQQQPPVVGVPKTGARLSVPRLQQMLLSHPELATTRFRNVMNELLAMAPVLKDDLAMTPEVRGWLDMALDEVNDIIASGQTPIEDVKAWQKAVHESIFSDLDEMASRDQQAQAMWDRLGEAGRPKKEADLAKLHADNEAEIALRNEAIARGNMQQADTHLQSIERRTRDIMAWEPHYEPGVPKASAAERVAAQQADVAAQLDPVVQTAQANYDNYIAQMAAEGHPDPKSDAYAQVLKEELDAAKETAAYQPTDPSLGGTFDAATMDARSDIVGREVRGEVPQSQDRPIIESREGVARARKPRGQNDYDLVENWLSTAPVDDVNAAVPTNVAEAAERAMGFHLNTNSVDELRANWEMFNRAGGMTPDEVARQTRQIDRENAAAPVMPGTKEYEELSNEMGDLQGEIDRINREGKLKGANRIRAIRSRQNRINEIYDRLREAETREAKYGSSGADYFTGPQLNLPPEVQGALHWAESQGRRVLTWRPEAKPVIDFTQPGWSSFTWRSADEAARYDAYLDHLYDYSDLTHRLDPNMAKLKDSAHVAKAGDVAQHYFLKVYDRAYYGEGADDPVSFILNHTRQLFDPNTSLEDLRAIDDSWLMTKAGRENLRILRRHGPEIISEIQKGAYSPFVSLRGLQQYLPEAVNGKWDNNALKDIHTLLTRKSKPADMDWDEWRRVKTIQNAVREQWDALKATPEFYDPATKTYLPGDPAKIRAVREQGQNTIDQAFADYAVLKSKADDLALDHAKMEESLRGVKKTKQQQDALGQLHIQKMEAQREASRANGRIDVAKKTAKRDLDAVMRTQRDAGMIEPQALFAQLEPAPGSQPLDIHGIANDIGMAVAEKEAVRIGYNPEHLGPWQSLMASVKGNMSPLWMGMIPGYYIRNASGNIFSHLIAAINGDMHVGLNVFRSPRWVKELMAEEGAGTGFGRWVHDIGVTGRVEGDVATVSRTGKQYAIPRLIEQTPLLGSKRSFGTQGYYNWMQRYAGDAVEKFSKQNIYTQEWGWTFSDQWGKRIAQKVGDDAARTRLATVRGQKQLTTAMEELGLDDATKAMLRGQMDASISHADLKAYDTTAKVLRDYRMRNRLDGILDRIFPVHYWTTRNLMFVGRTAASRPGSIPATMAAFDAWEKENLNLPISMRTGLLPIPGKLVPFVDDNDTYMFRLSSFINPAIFAAAKFADPDKWDLSKTTLPDRLDGWTALGLRNAYQAMGYRIGPQYQLGSELLSAAVQNSSLKDNKWIAGFNAGSTWLDGAGYRSGIGSFLPFLNQAQNISTPIPGLNISPQQVYEAGNQLVYGSPYSRFETNNAGYISAGKVQSKEITLDQHNIIMAAIANRKFDYDPDYAEDVIRQNHNPNLTPEQIDAALKMVRPIMDESIAQRSWGYLASIMGVGGKTWTQANQQEFDASKKYGTLAGLEDFAKMPFGVGKGALRLADVVARDWGQLKLSVKANEDYQYRLQNYGSGAANLWADQNAPYIKAFWSANDPAQVAIDRIVKSNIKGSKDDLHAKRTQTYITNSAKINDAAPYFQRLQTIAQARDDAVARAGGNMLQVEKATQTFNQMVSDVYTDAWMNGIDMSGLGQMPKTSSTMRNRTRDQKHFLEVNDAMGAVEQAEVGQQQRAWFADQLAEQNNLVPFAYTTTIAGSTEQPLTVKVINPLYAKADGSLDVDAYNAAVKEFAQRIPQEYSSLVQEAINSGWPVAPTVTATNMTPEDFVWHMRLDNNPDLAAFEADRKAARAAINAMPTGDETQYAAKQAAILEFEKVYGTFSNKHWEDTTDGTTAYKHYLYDMGTDWINDWYYTLSPADKAAFKDAHPDAFNGDGKLIVNGKEPALTSVEVDDIVRQNNLAAIFGTSANGPERTMSAVEGDLPRQQDTIHIYDLRDQMKESLTPEQASALDAIEQHNYSDKDTSDRAYDLRNALDLSWSKLEKYIKEHMGLSGDDTTLLQWVSDQADLVGKALDVDAYDAREAWFNGLSPEDQQLLIQGDPKSWYPDASSDTTSGGGGGDGGGGGSSSTYSGGGSSYSGGSGSGGGRTISSGTKSGGSVSTSLGASGLGTNAPAKSTWQSVASLDPVLSAGQDDGRGVVAQQVAAVLDSLIAAFPGMDKTVSGFLMQGYLRWIKSQLGANPTAEQWQAILAHLTTSRKDRAKRRPLTPSYGFEQAAG